MAGYDYEFVPPLDSKYECPICCLCLRDPLQTSCGHRFCNNCILGWMSKGSEGMCHCPIDNSLLKESDLFDDACTTREIRQLRVKCTNSGLGCLCVAELSDIERHTADCSYQPVICPNKCSATVLRKELKDHLLNHCTCRSLSCTYCAESVCISEYQIHLLSCPSAVVPCEACTVSFPRKAIPSHLSNDCPAVEVACPFAEHGCQEKRLRRDIDRHVHDDMQQHLAYLSSGQKKMNAYVSELSRIVGLLQAPSENFSRHSSMRGHPFAVATPAEEAEWVLPVHLKDATPDCNYTDGKSPSEEAIEKQAHQLEAGKDSWHKQTASESEGLKELKKMSSSLLDSDDILKSLCDKSLNLDQRILKTEIQLNDLAELNKRLESAEIKMNQLITYIATKYAHGNYLWRIKSYSEVVKFLQNNPGKYVSSQSFYTTPVGYKFCLRKRLIMKNQSWFISLNIHLMQGENDAFLTFPFLGSITISILDCGPLQPKRHITEEMKSRPDLKAFARPYEGINVKGFGFADFADLEKVLNSASAIYVKNDELCILVSVKEQL